MYSKTISSPTYIWWEGKMGQKWCCQPNAFWLSLGILWINQYCCFIHMCKSFRKKNLSSPRYPLSIKYSANLTDLLWGRLMSVSNAKGKVSASKAHRWLAAEKITKPQALFPAMGAQSAAPHSLVNKKKQQPLAFGQTSCTQVVTLFARLKSASVCSIVSPQVISMDGYFLFKGIMDWQLLTRWRVINQPSLHKLITVQ